MTSNGHMQNPKTYVMMLSASRGYHISHDLSRYIWRPLAVHKLPTTGASGHWVMQLAYAGLFWLCLCAQVCIPCLGQHGPLFYNLHLATMVSLGITMVLTMVSLDFTYDFTMFPRDFVSTNPLHNKNAWAWLHVANCSKVTAMLTTAIHFTNCGPPGQSKAC